MKHLFLATILISAGLAGYGQCDKKVLLTSSQTEHLKADSSIDRTQDEHTVIEFDKSAITITPGNENTMTGKIDSIACNWSVPYKAGRTRIKFALTSPDGDTKNITITIEGKNGKITVLAEVDGEPNHKIRLVADKFEEKH